MSKNMSECFCIKIWRYEDAPKGYRDFEHDDVDWVAFIPNEILKKEDNHILFLEEGTPFGCCTVKKFKVDGGEVWIGCHA